MEADTNKPITSEVNLIPALAENIVKAETQTDLQRFFIQIDNLIPKSLRTQEDIETAKDCKQLYNLLLIRSAKLANEVTRTQKINPWGSNGDKYDQHDHVQETSQNQIDSITRLIDGGLKNTDNPIVQEMEMADRT